MVSTHSSTKDKKMVSKEISDYFTKLVEPLVTTQRLEEIFGKFKEEIIERFEEKFTAQNQKIVDLEEKIAHQDKKIESLSIKCDNNEQYSRRYCLRMHGLKYDKNENQNDIVSKFSECFSEIGLSYEEVEIDRVHRIGKPYKNEGSGLTMKSVIIKFKSWRYRQDVYRNQPRRFENGKKKPGENSFSVSLDLTRRRYNLLKIAQGIVKEMDNVSFVCADANCSLAICFKNGTIKHFNSEYEFRSLLKDN